MALDSNVVKMYVEKYITMKPDEFTSIMEDCMGEYQDDYDKYGLTVDDNYLMSIIILIRVEGMFKVRNAKAFMNLLTDFKVAKKEALKRYTNKFVGTISEITE